MTTHLQGVGLWPAVPARDLRPGQRRVYNFGIRAEIVGVEPLKSGKSVRLTTRESNGKLYTKTVRAETLIAVDN